MRDSGAAQVVIALSLVALTLGPFVAGPLVGGPSLGAGSDAGASTVATDRPGLFDRIAGHEPAVATGPEVQPVDGQVRVIAQLRTGADLPESVERKYAEVYTREGARQLRGRVALTEVRSLSNEPGVGAVQIQGIPEIEDEPVAPGVARIGADRLHDQGVTGKGVTVGVIDTGFQLTHPSIADHVSSYQSFDGATPSRHGTAVASVVADTAPGADLHLAAVGPTTTPAEYRRAVEWLKASGVDVVVDAGSYFGTAGTPGGGIADIAANHSGDVVFVTSAGNYARRHWAARVGNESGRVEFAPGAERNALGDGDPIGGRVTVSLRWRGSADYDLHVYREVPTGDVLVAQSTGPNRGSGVGVERISTTLPEGRYYVTVEANGTPAPPTRLELFASHELAHRTPSGSLTAPATADDVIAVGAYAEGGVESFSSRGPTATGDRGVDFVAPDTVRAAGVDTPGGTSFAAPYVAGTVALVASERPDLSPGDVETVLATSATDVGPTGADPASGYGLIDAKEAYDISHTVVLPRRPNRTGTHRDGEPVGESTANASTADGTDGPPSSRPVVDPLASWAGVVSVADTHERVVAPG